MSEPLAVTGIGAVTPLGVGAETFYRRWLSGESGISEGVGACEEFSATDAMSIKEVRRSDRFTHLVVAAGDEAVQQAGWSGELPYRPERIGCIVGTGVGGITTLEDQLELLRVKGMMRISPFCVPNMMPNAGAAALAIRYGLEGECFCTVAACAASAHAIGVGVRMLRADAADAVIVGGVEAGLTPLTKAAFSRMGATSPSGESRPFDRRRDGFVLAEGAGVMVLERLDAARERGAEVLAELLGYGASCDALHLTAPHADGRGAAMSIERALEDAGVGAGEVDYVNAHGTSTPLNDRSETMALKQVLGDGAYEVPVSAPKSAIGHLLGGCGTVESLVTVLALREREVPPTLNYAEPDEGLDLDYVPDGARPIGQDHTGPLVGISNSFGFGGHNATVVLRA